MIDMLSLNPTPLTLVIGIGGLITVGILSWLSWKRSPHPKRAAILEVMRMMAAIAVALLLWQPEWLTVINPTSKPRIAILTDQSKSMTTIDADLPQGGIEMDRRKRRRSRRWRWKRKSWWRGVVEEERGRRAAPAGRSGRGGGGPCQGCRGGWCRRGPRCPSWSRSRPAR